MASTVAAQTRDFARRFFAVVQELGREDWVPANDAFERTIAAHPDHPYIAYIQANRARRAGFSAAAERIREAEFPQIARRKAGTRRNAPVFYRVGSADAAPSLDLPYDVPPGHPLRVATEAAKGNPLRREAEQPEARSPWRRRQSSRRAAASNEASSAGAWWQRLADGAADLLDTVTRTIAKRAR
jgi:hypothetical protein